MSATNTSNLNLSSFLEVLKRSNLVEEDRLQRVLKSIAVTGGASKAPPEIAEQLIVAGLITKWQAAQLLKGRYRGFSLGKYIIRKPLGRGGMGVVYEAEHSVLGTRVAVKILPKARNDLKKSVSRFLAEARAAAKLDHPNIVRVHDCDVVDDRRFMVMDLVEGSNLGEVVEKHGPLEYRSAILLLKQAAMGLAYAHEHGITHRDVKPHNFLIDKKGQLKVADMGLAMFDIDSPERYTHDGNNPVLGTVDYLAPEQAWDSSKVDRRADMYSLGCTLYFMLAGRAPFNEGSMAQRLAMHQTAQPLPITELRPDCPLPIWRLCEKMLAKKPQDRLQRMVDVQRVCDQLLPRLSGNQELAGLANTQLGTASSGSDSWNGIDSSFAGGGFSFEPSLFDAATDPGMSSPGGFAAPAAAAPAAAGGYWAQVAAPPSAPKKKKSSKKDQDALYLKVAVVTGLTLALSGLGISIWMAITTDDKPTTPMIRTTEAGDGKTIVIVDGEVRE